MGKKDNRLEFPQHVESLFYEFEGVSHKDLDKSIITLIKSISKLPVAVSSEIGEPIKVSITDWYEKPGYVIEFKLKMVGEESKKERLIGVAFANVYGGLEVNPALKNLDLYMERALNDDQHFSQDRHEQFHSIKSL